MTNVYVPCFCRVYRPILFIFCSNPITPITWIRVLLRCISIAISTSGYSQDIAVNPISIFNMKGNNCSCHMFLKLPKRWIHNRLGPEQDGPRFADDIPKCIFSINMLDSEFLIEGSSHTKFIIGSVHCLVPNIIRYNDGNFSDAYASPDLSELMRYGRPVLCRPHILLVYRG